MWRHLESHEVWLNWIYGVNRQLKRTDVCIMWTLYSWGRVFFCTWLKFTTKNCRLNHAEFERPSRGMVSIWVNCFITLTIYLFRLLLLLWCRTLVDLFNAGCLQLFPVGHLHCAGSSYHASQTVLDSTHVSHDITDGVTTGRFGVLDNFYAKRASMCIARKRCKICLWCV